MDIVYTGSGSFCTIGEQLAAPGLAIEQLAQEVGDFALSGAGVENSTSCSSWKRDEPGSCSFRHVTRVGIKPSLFNSCKSNEILLSYDPQEDAIP